MRLEFKKYEGTGNDFLLVDSRSNSVRWHKDLIIRLCDRHFGIGADGLLVVGKGLDVAYYNADGSRGFCGNGARCVADWAHQSGLNGEPFRLNGVVLRATFADEIAVYWTEEASVVALPDGHLVEGKTPHFVREVKDLNAYPVVSEGRRLRQNTKRFPLGVNVNFIAKANAKGFSLRTYERGVEDETLSCGTGVVAAARVLALTHGIQNPFVFHTRGGRLKVKLQNPTAGEVKLQGPVHQVYDGRMTLPDRVPKTIQI